MQRGLGWDSRPIWGNYVKSANIPCQNPLVGRIPVSIWPQSGKYTDREILLREEFPIVSDLTRVKSDTVG
jgi:hypothetical protein